MTEVTAEERRAQVVWMRRHSQRTGLEDSARAQQRLSATRVRLVDEQVRSLVRRAVHVVDPILLQRPREAVH